MKCSKCKQYEEDENDNNRGWCHREHKWVEWNDTDSENDCGYYED